MKIIKVINNNTVSVIDDKGKEQIISGKGIGFGKKYGDEPDKDKIQKMYFVTDSELRKRLIECLTEIPYEHIKLTALMQALAFHTQRRTCPCSLLRMSKSSLPAALALVNRSLHRTFLCSLCRMNTSSCLLPALAQA